MYETTFSLETFHVHNGSPFGAHLVDMGRFIAKCSLKDSLAPTDFGIKAICAAKYCSCFH